MEPGIDERSVDMELEVWLRENLEIPNIAIETMDRHILNSVLQNHRVRCYRRQTPCHATPDNSPNALR
jgi:hypothetical protein